MRLVSIRTLEDGITTVEYALMVAIIALLLAAGFYFLYQQISGRYSTTATCIATDPAPKSCS